MFERIQWRIPGRKSTQRKILRGLRMEMLERREMFRAYMNPVHSLDVNDDRSITSLDALNVINKINTRGTSVLPQVRTAGEPLTDTNGDGSETPLDALLVINRLNQSQSSSLSLDLEDGSFFAVEETIRIGAGKPVGTRTYAMQVDSHFADTTDLSLPLDQFSVYLVKEDRGHETLLDQGLVGSPIFTLNSRGPEIAPGITKFDGQTLSIDLTNVEEEAPILRFQLLNHDGKTNSRVSITPQSNIEIPLGQSSGEMLSEVPRAESGGLTPFASLTQNVDATANVSLGQYNRFSGEYQADITILNQGSSLSRESVVVLAGLPTGVAVIDASGMTPGGVPYISFKNAIPDGGLGPGETSQAIRIRLQDPLNKPFSFTASVYSGIGNRAPSLNAIGTITVMPGEMRAVKLAASDADADAIRFGFANLENSPTMRLSGDDLIIAPTPGEIGSYNFEITATDGMATATREVVLNVVPDPVTSTRVSGRILNVDGAALASVRLSVGNQQAITSSDGSFLLELGVAANGSDTLRIHAETIAGGSYPFIAEKLALLLGHDVYQGFNNQILRPIYLPMLNVGTTINPGISQTVSQQLSPNESPASVTITAGSLFTQQGAPFSGRLSITEVPGELTPAALPANLFPDLVVTIQPGEMSFATPAKLTLPNRANYATGQILDLWSIDPVSGAFTSVGQGQVSPDGTSIETIKDGIRNSSWHFFAPPPPVPPDPNDIPQNQDNNCNCNGGGPAPTSDCDTSPDGGSCEATAAGGSSIELHSGAFREWHSLVTYQSLGQARGWTLHYNSETANPVKVVTAGFDNTVPDEGSRFVFGVGYSRGGISFGSASELPEIFKGLPAGAKIWRLGTAGSVRGGIASSFSGLPSGMYDAKLTSGLTRFSDGQFSGTTVDQTLRVSVFNREASSFGAGWGLGGLMEIVENPDGSILLLNGNGTQQYFGPPTNGTYAAAPGDFSVMQKLPSGEYLRTWPTQTKELFAVDGKLLSVTDRNGNSTRYSYTDGLLSKVTDPVDLVTNFVNVGGRLSQIIDPAGRITKLDYDNRGNLVKITDPDGSARSFNYDSKHLLTREIDKRGFEEKVFYNSEGRVTGTQLGDGSKRFFEAAQSKNTTAKTLNLDPLTASVGLPGSFAVAKSTDGNGNVTITRLDRLGQAIFVGDAIGTVGIVQRNGQNLVTNSIDGRGNETHYTFDSQGHITRVDEIITSDAGLENPTIRWVGASSGNWNDPLNWSLGRLPTPEDDVLIAPIANTSTISIQNLNVQVRRLYTSPLVDLSLIFGELEVSGRSNISGAITLGRNGILSAKGSAAEVSIAASVTIDRGTIRSLQGGLVRLPTIKALASGQFDAIDGNIELPGVISATGATMNVSGTGKLIAPALTTLVGNSINVTNGANLTLPATTQYVVSWLTGLNVSGAGSTIAFPSLSSLILDGGKNFHGGFAVSAGGTIELPLITKLADGAIEFTITGTGSRINAPKLSQSDRLQVILSDGGRLESPLLESMTNGILSLSNSPSPFPLLHDISGTTIDLRKGSTINLNPIIAWDNSAYAVFEGSQLTIPYVSYTADAQIAFSANGTGSRIELPNLALLLSTGGKNFRASVSTSASGVISMPMVTSIDTGYFTFTAEGAGSQISLPRLQSATRIESLQKDGGSIVAPNLATFTNGTFAINNSSPGYPLLRDITATSIDVQKGSSFNLSQIAFWDNSSYKVSGGSQLTVPYTSYTADWQTAFAADGVGSRIDLPNLTQLLSTGGTNFRSDISVTSGGTINMPVLQSANTGFYDLKVLGTGSRFTAPNATDLRQISIVADNGTLVTMPQTSRFLDLNNDTELALTSASLTIGRTFEQRANGKLSFSYDTAAKAPYLNIVGNAKLGGQMLVDFSLQPTPNDSLPLATFASRTGQFTLVQGTNLPSGYAIAPSYSTTAIAATISLQGSGEYTPQMQSQYIVGLGSDRSYQALVLANPEGENPTSVGLAVARHYTYDQMFHQLTSSTDELGRVTTYTIDPSNGNRISIRYPNGDTIRYTYRANGLLSTITDARGIVTELDYDRYGNRISVTYAKGTTDESTVRYEHDLAGNITAIIDGNGNRTVFEYDSMNRITKTIEADPDGTGLLQSPVSTFAFDVAGNLTEFTDALGHRSKNQYDSRNRLERATSPDPDGSGPVSASVMSYRFDPNGNTTSMVDPLGKISSAIFDARNRTIETKDAGGSRTQFSFDVDNNLVKLVDPVGNATKFSYDSRDRQVEETDPLGASIEYAFDAADNLVEKIDRNGRKTAFAYDDRDRFIGETWVGGNNTILYTYDASNNLTSATDASSKLTYSYDAQNRVASVDNQGTPNFPRVVLSYEHDDAGNVMSMSENIMGNTGATTSYSFDALNRQTGISQQGNSVDAKSVQFEFNALGQYSTIKRYSGPVPVNSLVTTSFSYDQDNRLTQLQHIGLSNENFASFGYTYDVSDRIVRVDEKEQSIDYEYNARDELIGANYSSANRADETFQFDTNGNRKASDANGSNYQTGTANRLLSDGIYDYTYDREANLSTRTEISTGSVRSFQWDYRNRLVSVSDKNVNGALLQVVKFRYDSVNRRIAKTVDATPLDGIDEAIEKYAYNGDDVILDFINADGAEVQSARYLRGPGIDNLLAIEVGTGAKWVLQDQLGSTRAFVNFQNSSLQSINYDAFGNVVESSSIKERFLFTGREYDVETDLYYFRSRYYSSHFGKFLSEDSLGFIDSYSLYAYAHNSPTSYRDPTGHIANVVGGIAIWALIRALIATGGTLGAAAILNEIGKSASEGNSGEDVGQSDGDDGDEPSDAPKPECPTPDDIIENSTPIPGKPGQRQKHGGASEANNDFDSLKPQNIIDRGNGVRTGNVGGTKITVRPHSSPPNSRPTVDIQRPNGTIKIRY